MSRVGVDRHSGPAPILVDVASRTQWSLLGRLAERLLEAGERVVVSYDGSEGWSGPSAEDCDGVEPLDVAGLAGPMRYDAVHQVLDSRRARFLERFCGTPDYRKYLRFHRNRLATNREALRRVRPRLLIVGEDGISGNAWMIGAARERGLPVLVCPYGYGGRRDLQNALSQKRAGGELILARGRAGDRVRRKHPRWVMPTPDGPGLLFPPDFILAREKVGLGLRDPWTVHGGWADRIAVESEAMRRHYRKEGLPEGKLTLTGSVYCDVLHDALVAEPGCARAFEAGTRIAPGETRVLVALPPSFHGERAAESEFASFAELCRETLGFLAGLPDTRVTVSVHPATLAEDRRAIAETGVSLSDYYILELLPRHDLYVTCFSSTVRWAIACRKPVVNYDMYRFRLPDYEGLEGVPTEETQQGFRRVAGRLVRDEGFYGTLARAQHAVSRDWGILDGRNFERIHGLIRELAGDLG